MDMDRILALYKEHEDKLANGATLFHFDNFARAVRREALEDAAKVCEGLRHDEAELGPYEYLGDCAAAIRALIETDS